MLPISMFACQMGTHRRLPAVSDKQTDPEGHTKQVEHSFPNCYQHKEHPIRLAIRIR